MSASSGDCLTPVSEDAEGKNRIPTFAVKPPRTQTQGIQLVTLGLKSAKVAAILFVVWVVGYFGLSVTWVLFAVITYVVREEYVRTKESKKAYGRHAVQSEQEAILARVDELPSWVYFPDVERAEWLNKMIHQMWPYIGEFVKTMLNTSVESIINTKLPEKLRPLRFEKINLGKVPPRIGGIKVYVDKVRRDEILLDVELMYASDADVTVSVRGLKAGVKDIMVQGTLRIVLKPLVSQIPLVGGLSIFFLSQPKIDFDLTDFANILDMPLLSTSLRTIVSDQIANFLVLPNKIAVPLIDSVSLAELKYPLPSGVVRLTIVEASELLKADFGMISKGKSDPYCKIIAGGRSYKTPVINNSVDPTWNETFEIIIEYKQGQVIKIDVLDEDPGEDDQLGSAVVDLEQLSSSGSVDSWLQLENVKTGRLHIKALWLYPSKDPEDIYKAKTCRGSDNRLSTALLVVTVDSAKDLLAGKKEISEPSPFVRLELGNHEEKTQVKQKTTNPRWEETFRFLVVDPELQDLVVEVFDTNKSNKKLGVCKVSLHELLAADSMLLNQPFSLKEAESECSINLRLALRLLTPDEPKEGAEDELRKVITDNLTSTLLGSSGANIAAALVQSSGSGSGSGSSVDKEQQQNMESCSSSISSSVFEQTDSSGLRYRGPTVPSDGRFGRIQVKIRYSTQRSRLIVVVHQCVNLIPCDEDNLSDPYVRLVLLPDKSSKKKKVPTATLR